jgi:hypothetical protein
MARPTTTGSTPEKDSATHTGIPSSAYTGPERTRQARTSRITPKMPSAAPSAGSATSWLYTVAELAQVELAARLQPDDEEEQRH